jgi:hypothetical protein
LTPATSALIGHTGFVGGNLAAQSPFDAFYNSSNVEQIAGRSFVHLVISAMPAAMWIADRDPEADRAAVDRLTGSLTEVHAAQSVVIPTVAVYPAPREGDENFAIDTAAQTPCSLAVRLPRLGFRVKELPVRRVYPNSGPLPSKIGGFSSKLGIVRLLLLAVAGRYSPK